MKKGLFLHLILSSSMMVSAQAATICHDDGRVTFQYKNDRAKEVLVDVQFAGRNLMTRDAKGLGRSLLVRQLLICTLTAL